MDITVAIQICQGYGKAHGYDNFLDALQFMQTQQNRHNLSNISETAFNTVVAQGVEMFAPV